jgi:hypothetical protein
MAATFIEVIVGLDNNPIAPIASTNGGSDATTRLVPIDNHGQAERRNRDRFGAYMSRLRPVVDRMARIETSM